MPNIQASDAEFAWLVQEDRAQERDANILEPPIGDGWRLLETHAISALQSPSMKPCLVGVWWRPKHRAARFGP